MNRLVDWRDLDTAVVEPLIGHEASAYGRVGWNVSEAWRPIEPARRAGHLPGVVLSGPAGVRGWACYLRHRDALQVAMLVADDASVTAALVDHILSSPEAARSRLHTAFVRAAAPCLREVLADRGFDVAAYAYRMVTPRPLPVTGRDLRVWTPRDGTKLAILAKRAYAPEPGQRVFAPGGTFQEWEEYLATLLEGNTCGRFQADLSYVAGRNAGRLDGAILTTALDDATVHVAQLLVAPAAQGSGIGTGLLARVIDGAAHRGCDWLSLLVSEHSARARVIYDRFGFETRETFVSAVRSAPLVDQRGRLDGGHQHATIGGERRLAALDAGDGTAPGQLGVGKRRQ